MMMAALISARKRFFLAQFDLAVDAGESGEKIMW
jgi:hypothetical protein